MNKIPNISELIDCVKDVEALERQFFPKEKISFFDAIGFSRQEIRHSRLLSFLLNPNCNHHLADSLIKEILLKIASEYPEKFSTHEALGYITGDFNDAKVVTEWHHIDIYFESKQNKIIVAIENKIGAKEHGNQLKSHEDRILERSRSISKNGEEHKIILLYLTPDEAPASNPSWIPISYELILDSLKSARTANNIPINSDAWRLIEEYIRLIEREIIVNTELKDALQEIYQKHKTIFDLVFEARDEDDGSFEEEIRAALVHKLSLSGIEVEKTSSHQWAKGYMRGYGFIPKSWLSAIPNELESTWWQHKKPVTWFIKTYYKDDKLNKLELWLDFKGDWIGDNTDKMNLVETIRKQLSVTSKNRGKQSKGGIILQSISIQENNKEEDIATQLSIVIKDLLPLIENSLAKYFSDKNTTKVA